MKIVEKHESLDIADANKPNVIHLMERKPETIREPISTVSGDKCYWQIREPKDGARACHEHLNHGKNINMRV